MNKILKTISALSLGILLLVSCERNDDLVKVGEGTVPVLVENTLSSAYIVSEDNLSDLISISVQKSNYGVNTDVRSEFQIALAGTDFKTPTTIGSATNEDKIQFTYKQLNDAVLALGAEVGVAVNIEVRIKSYMHSVSVASGKGIKYSEVKTISVTPYEAKKVEESYLYALGTFNEWSHATSQVLTSLTGDGIYVGYINFPAGTTEFKITEDKSWDKDYGDNGADGILDFKGANIKFTTATGGYHKLTVNMNTKTFKLEKEYWGLIGDATPNAWNTPDTSMTWNGEAKVWEVELDLKVGEIKFRANNDWGLNYGDNGADGSLEVGGGNIKINEAGKYKVQLDLFNLTYKLTKI